MKSMSAMRIRLLIVISILSLYAPLRAQWHLIPTGIDIDLNGLFFINDNQGFLAAKSGDILSIKATEAKWRIDTLFQSASLKDIYFFENGRIGFAYGSKGVLVRTDDSGRHWTGFNIDSALQIVDIGFFDSTIGLMIGMQFTAERKYTGTVLKSSDGGKSWDALDLQGIALASLELFSDSSALICGSQFILSTGNKGKNWNKVSVPPGVVPKALAIRGNKGIIVGMGGFLALSEDSGKNWHRMNILSEKVSLFRLLMIDSLRAYAVGSDGEILYTDDSGHNWVPEASGTIHDLFDIQMVGKRIYACGKGGALIYRESGE